MKIENLSRLQQKLRILIEKAKADENAEVVVGYSAAYAVYVHEIAEPTTLGKKVPRPSGLGHYWGPHDYGPGFLSGPARALARDGTLGELATAAMKRGAPLSQALYIAGLRIQRDSQEVVPVEYGNLRASAFTRLERT
jgi:hypothetical protein